MILKFHCCGLVYSTTDPKTYWCIETYKMMQPTVSSIQGVKVVKELVYTLLCKKNGCRKVEIRRYTKENGKIKLLMTKELKNNSATNFLKKTQDLRIRLPQYCPMKQTQNATSIPWVYGKSLDGKTQVARYMDESGDRKVFENNKWQTETFDANTKIYTLTL